MSRDGRRVHALVMGADHYPPPEAPSLGTAYPSLSGCVNDAERVANVLLACGMSRQNLDLLVSSAPADMAEAHGEPTLHRILASFDRLFERARPGDVVWIHFSGHGGRTTTAFPTLKGKTGIDEALVPTDIGRGASDYLRDVEIGFLLERMVRKGLLVNLVLDCCHSGGMTRDDRPAVPEPRERSHPVEDWRTPRASRVAPRLELEAAWHRFGAPWVPADQVTSDLAAEAPTAAGYVLLAACRAHERAYEYEVEPGARGGALTWEWCEAIRELGPRITHRECFERLRARLRQRFEGFQTPRLEGEADRWIFGGETADGPRGVTVLAIEAERVLLATGASQGVSRGARFAIHPLVDRSPGPDRESFHPPLVEVEEVGGGESWARWLDRGRHLTIAGDRAIPVVIATPRQTVGWRVNEFGDVRLRRLVEQLRRLESPYLRWVDLHDFPNGGETVDFELTAEPDGRLLIEIPGRTTNQHPTPDLLLDHTEGPRDLLGRLEHLARFRFVEGLVDHTEGTPLENSLALALHRLADDFRPGSGPIRPLDSLGSSASLAEGSWVALGIENRGDRILEIAVLDLASRWAIAQVYPAREDSLTLEPGARELLPLEARLANGRATEHHRLRVFATLDPVRWHWLELPALGHRLGHPLAEAPQGPLERSLLDFLFGGSEIHEPRELVNRAGKAGREWIVRDVTVAIHHRLSY